MRRLIAWLAALAILATASTAAVLASQTTPTPAGQWIAFTNDAIGYQLSYPDNLRREGDGAEVFFRGTSPIPFLTFLGPVPVVVRWETESEGLRRGTWFGSEPVADITLGGVAGKEYIYSHGDFFASARTVAYVIPYRGKYLGLEFRTDGELDEDQQRILASFRLIEK